MLHDEEMIMNKKIIEGFCEGLVCALVYFVAITLVGHYMRIVDEY